MFSSIAATVPSIIRQARGGERAKSTQRGEISPGKINPLGRIGGKPTRFGQGFDFGQAVTQAGHMTPASQHRTPYKPIKAKDSETTLDGNSVVLEEEMMKMAEARMNYDAAISFYQKSLGMLRLASRAPGRG